MKMPCRNVRALLSRLLDNDLPEEVRPAVEAHLRRCAACRREHDLLVTSWELLDSYEAPQVSEGFTRSLMRRVRSEQASGEVSPEDPRARAPRPKVLRRGRLAWAAAAAVVAAAGIGAIWGWIDTQRPTRTTTAPAPDTSIPAATTPTSTPPAAHVAVRQVTDEELVRDLDIYENLELLRDLELFSDLDAVEELDGSS